MTKQSHSRRLTWNQGHKKKTWGTWKCVHFLPTLGNGFGLLVSIPYKQREHLPNTSSSSRKEANIAEGHAPATSSDHSIELHRTTATTATGDVNGEADRRRTPRLMWSVKPTGLRVMEVREEYRNTRARLQQICSKDHLMTGTLLRRSSSFRSMSCRRGKEGCQTQTIHAWNTYILVEV